MKAEDLYDLFYAYDEQWRKFEYVENKLSSRPDLHALIRLAQLFPSEEDIIASFSDGDEGRLYLNVDPKEFAEKATESLVVELVRCGVAWADVVDGLYLFV